MQLRPGGGQAVQREVVPQQPGVLPLHPHRQPLHRRVPAARAHCQRVSQLRDKYLPQTGGPHDHGALQVSNYYKLILTMLFFSLRGGFQSRLP